MPIAYDVAVRAWAGRDSHVRRIVENTDKFRLSFVRTLFSEMGFKGLELEARTRSFVLTMSSENAFLKTVKPADQKKLLKAQFAFFTRP